MRIIPLNCLKIFILEIIPLNPTDLKPKTHTSTENHIPFKLTQEKHSRRRTGNHTVPNQTTKITKTYISAIQKREGARKKPKKKKLSVRNGIK